MKSNFKAIFAIFAVALMLLVAAVPAVGVFTDSDRTAATGNDGESIGVTITINVMAADKSKLNGYTSVTIEGATDARDKDGTNPFSVLVVNGTVTVPATITMGGEVKINVSEALTVTDELGNEHLNAAYGLDMPEVDFKHVTTDVVIDIVAGRQAVTGTLYLKDKTAAVTVDGDYITEISSESNDSIDDVKVIGGEFVFCGLVGETYTVKADVAGISFEGKVTVSAKSSENKVDVVADKYMVYGTANVPGFEALFEDEKTPVAGLGEIVYGSFNNSLECNWYASVALYNDEDLAKTATMTADYDIGSSGIEKVKASGTIKTTDDGTELSGNAKLTIKATAMSGYATIGGIPISVKGVDYSSDDTTLTPIVYGGFFFVGNKTINDDEKVVDIKNAKIQITEIKTMLGDDDLKGFKFAQIAYSNGVKNIECTNEVSVEASTDSAVAYKFKIAAESNSIIPADFIIDDDGKVTITNEGISFYAPIGTKLTISSEDEKISYATTVNADTVIPTFVMPKKVTFTGVIMDGGISVSFDYTKLYKETVEGLVSNNVLYLVVNGVPTDVDITKQKGETSASGVSNFDWHFDVSLGWYYTFDYTYQGNETIGVQATAEDEDDQSTDPNVFYFDPNNNIGLADPVTGLVDTIEVYGAELKVRVFDATLSDTKPDEKNAWPIAGVKVTAAIYAVHDLTGIWERVGELDSGVSDIAGYAYLNIGLAPEGVMAAIMDESDIKFQMVIETEDAYISDIGLYTFSNMSRFINSQTYPEVIKDKVPASVKNWIHITASQKPSSPGSIDFYTGASGIMANERTITGMYTVDGSTLSGFQMAYAIAETPKSPLDRTSALDVGVATIVGPLFFINVPYDYVGSEKYTLYTTVDTDKFSVDGMTSITLVKDKWIAGVQYKAKSTAPVLTYGLDVNVESLVNTFSDMKGLVRDIEEAVGAITTIIHSMPEYFASNMYKVTVNGLPYNPVDSKDDIKIGDKVNIGVTRDSYQLALRNLELGGGIELNIGGTVIKLKDLLLKLGYDYADYALEVKLDALRYVDQDGISHNVDMKDSTTFELKGNTTIYGAIHVEYKQISPDTPSTEQKVDPSLIAIGIAAIIVALIAFVYVIVTQRRQ